MTGIGTTGRPGGTGPVGTGGAGSAGRSGGGSGGAGPGGFHRLRVSGVQRLCDDAVAVSFAVPAGLRDRYTFRPGQHLTLRRGGPAGSDERRSYSICAPAGGGLRVGVRRIPGGLFSGWLVDGVRPGDEVEVAPPVGTFTPEPGANAHHGLIGAGSGITPLLSIAASVLAGDDVTRVSLIYGNRRADTVMFAEELADLKNRYRQRLHLVHVLSREPGAADIVSGRLDRARLHTLLTTLVDPGDVDHWWLCGPLGMTDAARAVLAGLGVPGRSVHRELFWVDEPPPAAVHVDPVAAGARSRVTVVHGGRTTELSLPRDAPVLDAAQRVRADLPFACKGGVCGTCRARVTAGRVSMRRNHALEADELAAGFVLTCQALPVTERLTLDYDS